MRRGRRAAWAVLSLMMLVPSGCKLDDLTAGETPGGPDDPVLGTLSVELTTPHTDDGAIRLTVTGPYLTTPMAASTNHRVFTRQLSPRALDVVVVGDLATEPILMLPVRDVGLASEYTVTVTQAADRTNIMRTDLSGYGATASASP